MDKPTKLILDYSKWICGEGGEHQLGEGCIALKNDEGFMCCLGQWSIQLGATEEEILNYGDPGDTGLLIDLLSENRGGGSTNTALSNDCIDINDNTRTTPEEKIKALTERLHQEGIELEVINKP